MEQAFKKRWRKVILYLIAGFVILFVFRLIYGYTKTVEDTMQTQFFESISDVKRNYASKEYSKKADQVNLSTVKVDQKYEKIAEINSQSAKFDEEEKEVRKQIEGVEAIIQFEQKSGNKGTRKLNLVIGVPPENFDLLYEKLIAIGKVQDKQITKKDKTNEYKKLNAERLSLEKIRNSLLELKSKGGQIEEFINLENRILDIEQQLQGLGVSLGDFDDENEFCTVKFSLLEGKEVNISLIHRLKVSLEWTVKIYLQLITILFFASFFSWLFLLVIDRLKVVERIVNKKP